MVVLWVMCEQAVARVQGIWIKCRVSSSVG